MSKITVDERAAVIGASLLKKNAAAYYMENRTDDAEVIDKRKCEIEGLGSIDVVEYSEYDSIEYWECDDCYTEITKSGVYNPDRNDDG